MQLDFYFVQPVPPIVNAKIKEQSQILQSKLPSSGVNIIHSVLRTQNSHKNLEPSLLQLLQHSV